MIYGSVCSGIEAATMAWHPLGWTPAFFSEIEKFPSAVLAHHYGSNMPGEAETGNGVPNHGDMTNFQEWPDHAIDLLVGGTPCQTFSIAGLRAGLDDTRGNLMLIYGAIAQRYRPRWLAWENVPGVLSSNEGRDFASLLGLLSGRRIEVPGGGWSVAGIIPGYDNAYGLAWRVLDAQFIRVDGFPRAVPQRRRRVFVIGYFGDWRRAAAILLEPESMHWNPPPRREAGERASGTIDVGAHPGSYNGQDAYNDKLVAHALRAEGFDASEDGTGRGTPIVPVAFQSWASITQSMTPADVSPTLDRAKSEGMAVAFDLRGREGGAQFEGPHETANIRAANGGSSRSYVAQEWKVRRLTPRECERLQGFPDDFTLVPFRGKAAADGPRYKALGNSMAVNVMEWLGRRIQMVESIGGAA